jgi:class 3 adenylate cyclase/TolB-like protein
MAQESTIERRLAAIVATDIVGYSRLIEADEEGTLARVTELRRDVIDPALARHRGRIVKTSGDGLLIEFASVVEAVRCAAEIRDEVAQRCSQQNSERRIQLRIGVNLGDVVVESGDIFGDGVNIAARLEAIAEPNSIYISQAARDQLDGKLQILLEDLGERHLKNIARPVRVYRVGDGVVAGSRSRPAPTRRRRRTLAIAVTAAVLVIAGGSWLWREFGESGRPRTASVSPADSGTGAERLRAKGRTPIAVLPFANLGDDEKNYFSDGLTEEIITALGRFSSLSVLARNAVMPYKGTSQSPLAIARALGVRYVVEGSVRRTQKQVRVSVQLSDPEQGRVLWAQQFDSELGELFAMQDEITRRIVGVLAVRLTRAEQERVSRKATDNLEAHDMALRGRALMLAEGRRANVEARALFQRAIELDPGYGDAHVGLGFTYIVAAVRGWIADPDDALRRAEAAARKAIQSDDRNAGAYTLLGRVLSMRQQYDSAEAALRRALELNPSDSTAYSGLGDVLLYSGAIGAAIEALETALAFDPSPQPGMIVALPLAYYLQGRYRDSINFVEGKLGRHAEDNFVYVVLAMAYAQSGQADDARASADLARLRNPVFDSRQFGTRFRDPAHQAKVREGLRKAGLE